MKGTKGLFRLGMLALALSFMAVLAGCDNPAGGDDRSIASELIGKWEFNSVLASGTTHALPYGGINTGGYEFTSRSFKSYMNGSVAFEREGYTEDNRIYASDGQAGYTYSLSGDSLTANAIDGSSGVIATKVIKFSWE
ncbi:MAG: hypothetical protein LBG26_02535 [Treponema sp.]|jgi:hypothetical protein|nr:hypothetical protein [Treponema sp.]